MKYRHMEVNAEQWTGTNFEEIRELLIVDHEIIQQPQYLKIIIKKKEIREIIIYISEYLVRTTFKDNQHFFGCAAKEFENMFKPI